MKFLIFIIAFYTNVVVFSQCECAFKLQNKFTELYYLDSISADGMIKNGLENDSLIKTRYKKSCEDSEITFLYMEQHYFGEDSLSLKRSIYGTCINNVIHYKTAEWAYNEKGKLLYREKEKGIIKPLE